jgi:xylulokinase
MGLPITEVRATGGGARSAFWRQMQCDVFNTPLVRMAIDEGAAFGAALLGGVAGGVYPDVPAACAAAVQTKEPVTPEAGAARRYAEYYPIHQGLYPALQQTFTEVAEVIANHQSG